MALDRIDILRNRALFWVALAFALFQLSFAVFIPMAELQLRALHVTFGIGTALLAFPYRRTGRAGAANALLDLVLIAFVVVACLHIFLHWMKIYMLPGESTQLELVTSALLLVVVLETTRRATGWIMPVLVVLFFAFVFVGPYLPGIWRQAGLPLEHVLNVTYLSSSGLFGKITGFSATFIAVFMIFGALLMHTGGGKTFMDLSLLIAGRFRGGPAKVAIVSSALFGSISGSAAANVSVTGNYTIPLMIKLGYKPTFAAGVESMASTGGVLTPPIMAIAAFIMAEFLAIPYIHVIGYATIPCLLFYIGLFGGVHFEALHLGLQAAEKEDLPHWREVITWSRLVPFVVPIFLLIYLLLKGFVLITAGFYASLSIIVLYLFADLSPRGMRERAVQVVHALSEGGRTVARIAPIMVSVSVLVMLLDLTGVAPKLSTLILQIGGGNLVGALLVAAIVPLILGTALPTTPSYIISAAVIAPALVTLDIDVVAAHMFLLYFAALSSVTPPTCTTVIIAANYANASWMRAAFVGMRLGSVAFLIPFFFILEPALLARAPLVEVIAYTASAALGAFVLSSGMFGYMRMRTGLLLRVLYGLCGLLLLYPDHRASLAGIVVGIVAFFGESHVLRRNAVAA